MKIVNISFVVFYIQCTKAFLQKTTGSVFALLVLHFWTVNITASWVMDLLTTNFLQL